MNEVGDALDEAFDRLGASGFELPNGFVNHGPMACEALATLGCEGDVVRWARRFTRIGGIPVVPERPIGFEPYDALGDYRRLPRWIGYFDGQIAAQGWQPVVAQWVPRLVPALEVALFHGAIRTGHAIRAISVADTEPRRAELARALAYWAARFRPGQPARELPRSNGLREAIAEAAAYAAARYLARPSILFLHGVTGAMAVDLFLDHVPSNAGAAALAQVHAEHAALFHDFDRLGGSASSIRPAHSVTAASGFPGAHGDDLVRSAASSGDPHQVKLVEACRRGLMITGDDVFLAAAQTVTGVDLRRE